MGRIEMQQGVVELKELTEGVIKTLRAGTQGRNIRWKHGELPVIAGDAAMLRQGNDQSLVQRGEVHSAA